MPVIFDAFTGQIIDTGPEAGMAIGKPILGATPNSVLVVDSASKLDDIAMPVDGQLLIGSAGNLPVAATLTQASASQVVITNGPGSITLGLPQDISTADSPVFTGLTLSSLSGPVKAGVGGALSASAIDLASSEVTNILTVDKGGTGLDGSSATNGQLLIGNGSGYTLAEILGTTNQVDVTNGAGSIQLSLPQNIHTGASPEFVNLTLSSLNGPVKAGVGGLLSSSAIDLSSSEVTNILTVDKGGTGVNGSAAPNGHILIGNGTGYTLADILGTTNQVNVANGAGSIQLSLPQDIHTGASPEFFDLFLAGTVDTAVLGGTLAFGTNKAAIINIGNPGATVNIQGTTIYQNVTNLNVTDKNVTVNVNGSVGSGGGAGIHVEEGGVSNAGHAEVTGDRLGWEFHPPGVAGIAYLFPGASGITLNQSSHDPVTIASPANGLGILNQVLSIELSSASATGALSSTDWSTFNGKQDALNVTAPLALNGLTDTLSISQSNTTTDGYLSSTDWTTFNNKEDYVAPGLTTQFYRGDKTWTQVDLTNAVSGTLPFANGGLGFNTATGDSYKLLTINSAEDGVIKREIIADDGIALDQTDDYVLLYNPNYVIGDTAVSPVSFFVENPNNAIGITLDDNAKSMKVTITLFVPISGNYQTSVVDVYLYQTGTIFSWANYDKTISYTGGVELVGLDVNIDPANQIILTLGTIPGATPGDVVECFSRAFNYA
jgi:hypothetical protein